MKFALILAVVVLASAPLAYAQKVTVKFDKAAPFAGYKTYKFESEGGARNPMISQLIVTAVERELNAIGLKKVDVRSGSAHLFPSGLGNGSSGWRG